MLYIKLDDNPGNMTLQTDPLNPLNNSSDSAKPHADKQSSPGQKTPATEEQGELFPDMDEESRKHFMVGLHYLISNDSKHAHEKLDCSSVAQLNDYVATYVAHILTLACVIVEL